MPLTLAQRLAEAEEAYHRLLIGRATVDVRDSNGDRVVYGAADRAALATYIADLKRQIAGQQSLKTIIFKTSKGL